MAKTQIPANLQRHLATGKVERALLVERAAVDVAARTATLAFASETPYERYWGIEILDCTATAMRQGRLRSGANLLCDHSARDVVGVVESVEIGADRVARAVVRFGKSARAEEVFQDVVDGIRRNVSVGYMIHKAHLVETKEGVETYRVTDWEPFEVSLVSVPADASVGVGRSADADLEKKDLTVQVTVWQTDSEDSEDATEGTADEAGEAEKTLTPSTIETKAHMPTEKIEVVAQRNHAAEISAIATGIPGGADLAMRAIQDGKTVEEFQQIAIKALSTKPVPTADIGMTPTEVKRFSVLRAINALANPGDGAAQKAAAFERECSEAASAKIGKQSRGFMVPYDVQKRDLTVGSATGGGNLVATDLLSGSFIDILRNAMVLNQLGARMLTGLNGMIAIPKQTGAATAYWVAENGAPTESAQTIGQVTMAPKTVGAFSDISRRLLLQSSIDVEAMVQNDLATVLGLAIQQAAINGTGADNQPSGLLTLVTPGIIGGDNGAAPTWANVIALETAISAANADIGTLGYLTNAKVRGKLKGTDKFSSAGQPVWEAGNMPLNGYRAAVTNAVPSNLVKGSSGAVASAILFGNFADLVIGMWGGLDLMVDPYTGSTAGTIRVVALQDVDVAVRNVESFASMVDALTA
jgi:HK97 family phage major capsid protein